MSSVKVKPNLRGNESMLQCSLWLTNTVIFERDMMTNRYTTKGAILNISEALSIDRNRLLRHLLKTLLVAWDRYYTRAHGEIWVYKLTKDDLEISYWLDCFKILILKMLFCVRDFFEYASLVLVCTNINGDISLTLIRWQAPLKVQSDFITLQSPTKNLAAYNLNHQM